MPLDLGQLGEQAKREQQIFNRMLFDIEVSVFGSMVSMLETIDHEAMQNIASIAVSAAPYLLAAKGIVPPITPPTPSADSGE